MARALAIAVFILAAAARAEQDPVALAASLGGGVVAITRQAPQG